MAEGYTLDQLEQALFIAHRSGKMDQARKLAAVVNREREARKGDLSYQIPDSDGIVVGETVPQPPKEGILTQAKGAGEAALTTVSGATTGTLGMVAGTLKQMAEEVVNGQFGTYAASDRIAKSGMEAMSAATYKPKTQTGQNIVEGLGEAMEPLAAVAPMASEMAAISQSARAATVPVSSAARQLADSMKRTPNSPDPQKGAPSVGAAAVPVEQTRAAAASELPAPIKLTEGQATRDFDKQRFERETAKMPEEGQPIRDRFAEQNAQLVQNMDEFIDSTGSQLVDRLEVGEAVTKVIRERAAKDKAKIRSLYKEAEKAGEMEDPVDLSSLGKFLDESSSAESVAPVLSAAKKEMSRLGMVDESGNIFPSAIRDVESLRRFINKVSGSDPTNIKYAGDIKRLIDESTAGKGGEKYKKAREARVKYAKEYENLSLIRNLIGTKKGTDDRAIALENVVSKAVLSPSTSLEQMKQFRRILTTRTGSDGKQVWNEIRGSVLQHIKDQMIKGVGRNEKGDPVVSASAMDRAIKRLDQNGKLNYIFGKTGADKLRLLNDVAKDVLTAPAGSVNSSNTATVLAGMMDMAISGVSGIPAPITTSFKMVTDRIRDNQLKAKIKKSLGEENDQ